MALHIESQDWTDGVDSRLVQVILRTEIRDDGFIKFTPQAFAKANATSTRTPSQVVLFDNRLIVRAFMPDRSAISRTVRALVRRLSRAIVRHIHGGQRSNGDGIPLEFERL